MTDEPFDSDLVDPTERSAWRPLRELLAAMDTDIGRLYTDVGVAGLKTTYVMELIKLHVRGPLTITELAEAVQRTHSAMSQKVAAMTAAGFVETTPGADARSKKVLLTPKALAVVDRFIAEWRATEAAIVDLEAEIPYALGRVVADIGAALRRRSFHDRIADKLAGDESWP